MNIRMKMEAFLMVYVSLVITSAPAKEQKAFTDLTDCKLVKGNGNDGDSFSIQGTDVEGDKKKHVIRLYGVDCMETNAGAKFAPDRLKDQGLYFGIHKKDLARDKFKMTLDLGKKATKYTNGVLRKPFTVKTKLVPAKGQRPGRIYAYVITANGEDLGELLVQAGLARVYGIIDDLPEAIMPYEYRGRLHDCEMLAIKGGQGAWKDTDWKELGKERTEYRMRDYKTKLYINAMKNNAFNIELIAYRAEVSKAIAQAVLAELKSGAYKDKKDIDKRVDGVGKATADKLGKVLLFK